MLSFWIVEHLDVVEHVPPGLGAGFVGPAPYSFALCQLEEALGEGVVVAVATPDHEMLQVMSSQE